MAICGAMLLNSCIKEEAYVVETAELSVNLTRAGTQSTVQGDAITDAWIWAFQCSIDKTTGAPDIDDVAKAKGSRYVYGLNNYGNISVHIPLPICDGTQDYLLVALINTESFTGAELSSESTWGEIKSASFNNDAAFWDTYPNDEQKTPEVMPVSNWTTFTITSQNTHSDNCYKLNLPVYRAVAKTQFYASKADPSFDVDILDVKVVAESGYSNGMVLTRNAEQAVGSNSEAIQRGVPDAEAAIWWWNTPAVSTAPEIPTAASNVVYQMKNSDSGFTAVNNIATTNDLTDLEDGSYTWVASTFLFENNNDAPTPGDFDYTSQQGSGYNIYVRYSVDGEEKVAYTPLGKVVRNHDYQIKATIDSGGKMTLNIIVNEWLEDEVQIMDYHNTVTVNHEDRIKWTAAYDTALGGKTTINSDGTVTTLPVGDYDETRNDIVDIGSTAGGVAECNFALFAPEGGEWIAELVTIEGEEGAIVFENGNTIISGTIGSPWRWDGGNFTAEEIANPRVKLRIKSIGSNDTSVSTTNNIVELRISAKKSWGGKVRTYKVYGITGLDGNLNYKIIQPLGVG